MTAVVFDSGALIAVERRYENVLRDVERAEDRRTEIRVPAGCVAQTWRQPARQARLARFLRRPNVTVAPLSPSDARRVGILLGRAGGDDTVDGHVALLGLQGAAAIYTSDPDDIARLAPGVRIHRV